MGAASAGGGWFRRFHPAAEGAPRLLCFPHAGGAANAYQPLSELLSPHVDVVAVQYPGRQDRRAEPVHTDLVELSARIANALATAPDVAAPAAFFGHSMGAIVAFEVARRLTVPPPVLFAAGRRAPSASKQERDHPMSDDHILSDLRLLGGTEARLLSSRSFLRMILPVLRGDYEAIDTYSYAPGPPLDGRVVVLAGDDDPLTPVEDALAWRAHATGDGGSHIFAGGHFFLDDYRSQVAEIVLGGLARTPSGTP
ncbi:thioesterase [Actinomadura barringtoniae]|uniref:Thioesterase n=1 Tax=Actinomadura barringtoniae TaxID=1427535 RepID=A0A939P7V0_9ACTN|nr:alpha/beta fold hydrolase [Actinomadura barringtoniae]MBO2447195.1 thioesterase [Actinomadura barringtoniae]